MVYQIDEIKNKLYPIFKAAPIYRAILFGSYANGTADERSDIDILVESRGELHGLRFYGVLEDVVTILGKDVDLIEASEIRDGAAILSDINRQGVVLYER
ncbi:MAG TPA: nucleotidyltransferase domain-containing protein [Bacillota bacterium]|nr:nucleotidyltransferase domain-containing protein [Bacillota bacterium]